MNKKLISATFFFILLIVFSTESYAATTVEVENITLKSHQNNVTLNISVNASTISAGQGIRISYNITNLDPYCTKNFGTGFCDQITANRIDLQQMRFWIHDNLTYQTLSTSLYGLQTYLSNYDLIVPTIDSTCYDIKAELVYYDNNDAVTRFFTSNLVQRGTCLARNTTNQPCSKYVDCQEGLFCLDTDNNNVLDTCKASSTSYGYLCEQYGVGTKERVSKWDDSCRFYKPGLKNKNIKNGEECVYQQDCINGYCWDSSGDGSVTECNSTGTLGNSTGILVSSNADCLSPSCYEYWKCYSEGSILAGKTCSDGIWGKKIENATLKSEFRNVTYKFTYIWENTTHIIANATFSNNESSAFTLINAYFYFGDWVNITRSINVDLTQGQSRTEQYIITKPTTTPPRYYPFHTESLIKNATIYWWATSDSRCYDRTPDQVKESCCFDLGVACSVDGDCCSGNCASDYASSGKFCAPATNCVHNTTATCDATCYGYTNGTNAPDCYDTETRRYCNADTWATAGCGGNVCSGTCGTGVNSCMWRDNNCTAGSCGYIDYDCDTQQSYCDACLTGRWVNAQCCGDDASEPGCICSSGTQCSSGICVDLNGNGLDGGSDDYCVASYTATGVDEGDQCSDSNTGVTIGNVVSSACKASPYSYQGNARNSTTQSLLNFSLFVTRPNNWVTKNATIAVDNLKDPPTDSDTTDLSSVSSNVYGNELSNFLTFDNPFDIEPIQIISAAEPDVKKSVCGISDQLAIVNDSYVRGAGYSVVSSEKGCMWVNEPLWVSDGNKYVPYIFENHYKEKGYYLIINGRISVEVYDNYARFFDVNYTEVRVANETWVVEEFIDNNRWESLGYSNPTFTIEENKTVNSIAIIKTAKTKKGILNIIYELKEDSPLKHHVQWTALEPATVRLIQKWSNVAAEGVNGKEITDRTVINQTEFTFYTKDSPFIVHESQWSTGYLDEKGVYHNKILQPTVLDKDESGLKTDYIFSNWTLNTGESLAIDPETYTFQPPAADNMLRQAYPDYNYGGTNNIAVHSDSTGNRRSILKFDMSSIIPSGAKITFAELNLYYYTYYSNSPSGRTYWIYRITQTDWVEGTANGIAQAWSSDWNCRQHNTLTWTTAGGTYDTTNGSSATVPSSYGWMNWTVTAQVQYAVDNVNRVVHFLVKDGTENSSPANGAYFYSKEYTTNTSLRPKLYVNYELPPIITIQSPLNQSYRITSVWANVTLDETGSWCGRSLNGGANVTMSNDSTTHFYNQMTGLSQGSYNVRFYCNDTAGNMNGSAANIVYFTVDTTLPVWQNAGTNDTDNTILQGQAINLTAQGKDETALDWALLSTNETNEWKNYTARGTGITQTVSDSFTDETKIAVKTNVSVNTTTGQVKLNRTGCGDVNCTYTFQSLAADNDLDQAVPGNNYGGNPWTRVSSYTYNDRSILKFNMSSQIPTGATINTATLSLYYYAYYTGGSNPVGRTYWAYRMTSTDWVEGTGTGDYGQIESGSSCWNYRQYNTLAWGTAGGDYTTTNGASATVPSSYGWMNWTVTTQVQYAIDNVGKVAYFLLRDGTENSGTVYLAYFYTKEYPTDITKHPKLIVNYTPLPHYPSGELWSKNLLSGLPVTSINSFGYNASSIPSGTSLKVQFSQDNSTWYNSTGSSGGWNTLTQGINVISLSSLGWSGSNFYYKMQFNSNSYNNQTPVLDDINITYTEPQSHGSPMDMQDAINTWIWSNFTWQNSSVPVGTRVGWRIYYNDTAGNENVTNIMTFCIENCNYAPSEVKLNVTHNSIEKSFYDLTPKGSGSSNFTETETSDTENPLQFYITTNTSNVKGNFSAAVFVTNSSGDKAWYFNSTHWNITIPLTPPSSNVSEPQLNVTLPKTNFMSFTARVVETGQDVGSHLDGSTASSGYVTLNLSGVNEIGSIWEPTDTGRNVTITAAQTVVWKLYVKNSTHQPLVGTTVYLLVQGGNKSNASDVVDSSTITASNQNFTHTFDYGEKRDLFVEYNVTALYKNLTLRIYNMSTIPVANAIDNSTIFLEGQYTGYSPIRGKATALYLTKNTSYIFTHFNLTIPYNISNVQPNVYLHCLNFDFSNKNCTSWQVTNLTSDFSGNTTQLLWINGTSFDGGGGGQAKPDLYVVSPDSINENNTSPILQDPITFNITVWNIGDAAAPNVNVSCYRNTTYFDSDVINSIPPDVSQQTPRYAACHWTALAGANNISVKVDPDNNINEYNETNNEAWKLITVQDIFVNVTTDKASYNSSETVNASGYMYFTNTTGIPGKTINVTFINSTASVVQSRNATTDANGFYNDTYVLAQFIRSGIYRVNVTGYFIATRTNTATFAVYGATYGQQTHNPNETTYNSITQDQGAEFNLNITWWNQGPDTAKGVNFTLTNSSGIYPNATNATCGNVAYGSSCLKWFKIIIPAGTPPSTYWINSTADWINNNTITNSTIASTKITIGSNPQLTVPQTAIVNNVISGWTGVVGNFTINSTGNDALTSVTYSTSGGNLPAGWISYNPASISSLPAGSTQSVNVTVSVPSNQYGDFWTNISVTSGNDGSDWLWLNITALNWTVRCEAGGPYSINSKILVIGNTSYGNGTPVQSQVTIKLNDSSQQTKAVTTSSDGKYFVEFTGLPVGTYMANATALFSNSYQYCNDTFTVVTAEACIEKTIKLSGRALDSATGQIIQSGTFYLLIKETGDSKTGNVVNGYWSADFTTCLTAGRKYTLAIKITDAAGKSSWSQTEFIAS